MPDSASCLNCGKPLKAGDKFCSNCGQKNTSSRMLLKEVFAHFLTDYFAFDAAIWKSLRFLFFHPGRLTANFIAGHRKSFVPPFRLYIFISFIYFFALALTTMTDMEGDMNPIISVGPSSEKTDLEGVLDSSVTKNAKRGSEWISVETETLDSLAEGEEAHPFEEFFQKQSKKINANPALFMNSLFREISIAMFLLLPIFGGLLYLFHFKREQFYVSHLIHSVHIHSFLFALFTILIIEEHITDWLGFGFGALVTLIYLVLSLRNVYQQGIWTSIWKTLLLFLSYAVVLILAGLLVLIIAITLA